MKLRIILIWIALLPLAACLPQQEAPTDNSDNGGGGSNSSAMVQPAATLPPVSENDEPPVVNTSDGPVQTVVERATPTPTPEPRTFRGTSN